MNYRILRTLTTLIGLALLTTNPAWGKRALLDQVAATVNDRAISEQTLENRLSTVKHQLTQRGTPAPEDKVLRQQVLDHLIDESLQLQMADRMGVTVDNQSLNEAVVNIAKQNNLTLQQFRAALAKDGYAYDNFREDLRNEMTLQRVQQRALAPEVIITERELNQLVNQLKRSEAENDQYQLNHILIALPENPSPADLKQAKAKLANIKKELAAGKQFTELSVTYSDGQQALQGGDLGWRKVGELPTLFADKVKTMKRNEVAGPMRNASGYHLIQLVDKKTSAPVKPITQTKVRHILLQNSEHIPSTATRRRMDDLHKRLMKGESFAALAKAYSDDRASADNGGELGWVSPGATDPAFEKMMNKTKTGKISPVFESSFGWHILEVTERKEADMSDKRRREQANQQLFQRKLQEAQLGWIGTLRDQAHININ